MSLTLNICFPTAAATLASYGAYSFGNPGLYGPDVACGADTGSRFIGTCDVESSPLMLGADLSTEIIPGCRIFAANSERALTPSLTVVVHQDNPSDEGLSELRSTIMAEAESIDEQCKRLQNAFTGALTSEGGESKVVDYVYAFCLSA